MTRHYGISMIFGLMVMTMAFIAHAEESTAPSRGESVRERSRPEYEAEGVRVRSFKIKPVISTEEYYDSNIYAADAGEKEDYITVIKPGVEVNSDWSRHALNLKAAGVWSYYSQYDEENNMDYTLAADGRLDVLRETFLTGGVEYAQRHEDRGSPDDANGIEPTQYSELTGRAGFMRGLGRISLKLDGEAKQLDYDNVRTSSGSVVDNSTRDRNQYQGMARVGYEIKPGYEAFIRSAYGIRRYDNTTSLDRDSDGYDLTGGAALDISGKLRGEVFGGYMSREYDAASLKSIDGATFGSNLLWNPTGLTSLHFDISRTIEETTQSSTSGYVNTAYRISAEHELRRNIILGVGINYSNSAYEGAASGQQERNDDITGGGISLDYLLSRNLTLTGNYDYQERDSNRSGQDYTRNKVMVGLKLAM